MKILSRILDFLLRRGQKKPVVKPGEIIREMPEKLRDELKEFQKTKLFEVLSAFFELEERRFSNVMNIDPAGDKSHAVGYSQGVVIANRRARAFLKNLEARIEHVLKERRDQKDQGQDDRPVPEGRPAVGQRSGSDQT